MASAVQNPTAGEGCLAFYDYDAGIGINLVPMEPGVLVPRVGEIVYLPGERTMGAASYEVIEVRYIYTGVEPKREPGQAQQLGVQVRVQKRH